MEDVGRIEHSVRECLTMTVFLSSGYFKSIHCRRALYAALDAGVPRGRVHEEDTTKGGATLAEALRQAQHLALDEARGDDVRIVVLSRGYGTCGGRPLEVALDIGAGRRLKWTPPEHLVLKEVNSNNG